VTQSQLQLWDMILKSVTAVVALAAASAGAIRYFRARRREYVLRKEELAWRKTDLVVRLAEHFDKDPNIQGGLRLIEFGVPITFEELAQILRSPVSSLSREQLDLRYQVDRFFDFFDRIYHFVCVTKTLTPKDAECFTWYIRRIGQVSALSDFARQNGYEDLLTLYELYKPLFQSPEEGPLAGE